MKKLLVMLVAASFTMATTSCDNDEKVIPASKLPQAAQDFIDTHFADVTITRVVKDTEGSTEYDVRLNNGFKLEFSKSGNWREVEGYDGALPESFLEELPEGMITYIETNHSGQSLTKVELNKSSYDVEITGGLEIIFNLTGDFVRYDD
jgi:hypothetical protein